MREIWIDGKHKVVPVQIAGQWRYYPTFTRGQEWHYYKDRYDALWFVMPEAAIAWFKSRGLGR